MKPGDAAELYGTCVPLSDVAARAGLAPAAVLVPSAIKAERVYHLAEAIARPTHLETVA